jgi:hypothetical protein
LRSCSIISTSRSLRRNRVAHARVQSRRLDAGRIDPDKMIAATNAALSAKFGEGKYITAWWNPTLYVDYKLIEDRKLNKAPTYSAVPSNDEEMAFSTRTADLRRSC